MDIQNPARKLLHEPGREQAHVSGEADEVDVLMFESGDDFAIMLLARLAFRRNDECIQAALAGGRDSRGVWFVGDDDCDARVGDAARVNAVGDGDEVRAATGKEYAESTHF